MNDRGDPQWHARRGIAADLAAPIRAPSNHCRSAVRAPGIDAGRFRADLDAVIDQRVDD
jgi:hypothetical protein